MAIWKADEPVHCRPFQRTHEQLAPHDVRTADKHHLRVEHGEVRLSIFHSR